MERVYSFGRDKVYPAPECNQVHGLNPAKAPWSAPRGYTTTIKEESAALKAAVRLSKVSKPRKVKRIAPLKVKQSTGPGLWKRLVQKLNLCTFKLSNLKRNHEDINYCIHKAIGYVCCIRADVADT